MDSEDEPQKPEIDVSNAPSSDDSVPDSHQSSSEAKEVSPIIPETNELPTNNTVQPQQQPISVADNALPDDNTNTTQRLQMATGSSEQLYNPNSSFGSHQQSVEDNRQPNITSLQFSEHSDVIPGTGMCPPVNFIVQYGPDLYEMLPSKVQLFDRITKEPYPFLSQSNLNIIETPKRFPTNTAQTTSTYQHPSPYIETDQNPGYPDPLTRSTPPHNFIDRGAFAHHSAICSPRIEEWQYNDAYLNPATVSYDTFRIKSQKYVCSECTISFPLQSILSQHIRNFHALKNTHMAREPPYMPMKEQYDCIRSNRLSIVSDEIGCTYYCPTCEIVFTYYQTLESHVCSHKQDKQ